MDYRCTSIRRYPKVTSVSRDNEQYFAAQIDEIDRAMRQGDVDGVVRHVGHVRSESDANTADTLMKELLRRQLEQSKKKIRIWVTVAIVAAVGAAVTIAVMVPKLRLSTDTATTTTITQTQVSTVPPAPVATPTAPTSGSLGVPVPAPDANFAVLHELTDFTLGYKGCSDSDEGTLDIDELAPGYRNSALENTGCGGGFGLGRKGKYVARASSTQPTAPECEKQAKRGSQQHWEVEEVRPGDFALCVVSEKGNVAWVSVKDKDDKKQLFLKVIVWKPAR